MAKNPKLSRHEMHVNVLRAVRSDIEVVGLRQCRHFHEFGDAAENLGIGVEDCRRFLVDEVAETVAGIFVLAGGDGDRRLLRQLAVAGIIVGLHRLFEPVDVIGFDQLGELHG